MKKVNYRVNYITTKHKQQQTIYSTNFHLLLLTLYST